LTRKPNYFRDSLAFSSAMEGVCSAQVQAQNKHSRAGDSNRLCPARRHLPTLVSAKAVQYYQLGVTSIVCFRREADIDSIRCKAPYFTRRGGVRSLRCRSVNGGWISAADGLAPDTMRLHLGGGPIRIHQMIRCLLNCLMKLWSGLRYGGLMSYSSNLLGVCQGGVPS
jgi:hypothetical protein